MLSSGRRRSSEKADVGMSRIFDSAADIAKIARLS
jgi:hypothetical protein